MKGILELLTNFKWILKLSIPTVEMLQKKNSKSMQFFS
jgi:hypothetical protein